MVLNDGSTPNGWLEGLGVRPPSGAAKPLKDLRRDLEDLDATVTILWKFFLEPLWDKIMEISAREPGSPIAELPDAVVPATRPSASPGVIPARGQLVDIPAGLKLARVKCVYIRYELDRHGGNKTATARSLGINVKTLYNLLAAYGSELDSDAETPQT